MAVVIVSHLSDRDHWSENRGPVHTVGAQSEQHGRPKQLICAIEKVVTSLALA
jgi:hypothetical protein